MLQLYQQRICHTTVSYYNFNNNLGLKETPWVKTAYWHQPCKIKFPFTGLAPAGITMALPVNPKKEVLRVAILCAPYSNSWALIFL